MAKTNGYLFININGKEVCVAVDNNNDIVIFNDTMSAAHEDAKRAMRVCAYGYDGATRLDYFSIIGTTNPEKAEAITAGLAKKAIKAFLPSFIEWENNELEFPTMELEFQYRFNSGWETIRRLRLAVYIR